MFPNYQQPQQNRAYSAPLGFKCSPQLLHLKLHACLWLGVGAISLIPASPAEGRPALSNSPQQTPATLQSDTANILAQAQFRWPWERETNKSSQPSTQAASNTRLKWPSNLGRPKSNAGTGSRGSCSLPAGATPLTRIGGSKPLHKTVSDRPEIWFYSPYSQKEVASASFSLHFADAQSDEEIYRQNVALPAQASIVNVTLPAEAPALIRDRTYRWYLEISCSQNNAEISPAILTGQIQRVQPSTELLNHLDKASTPLERSIAYTEAGIWHEAFQSLIQLRRTSKEDSTQKLWSNFLSDQSVGLASIVKHAVGEKLNFIAP